MPFAPDAVTSSPAIPYSCQVSRIGTGKPDRSRPKEIRDEKNFAFAGRWPGLLRCPSSMRKAWLHRNCAQTLPCAAASPTPARERFSIPMSRPLMRARSPKSVLQTFDGNGNTNATATISSNGNIAKVTVQGTYTVNPDCTGTMILERISLWFDGTRRLCDRRQRGTASIHRHRLGSG